MATARMSVGAIFDVVTSTASFVTETAGALAESAGMANDFVKSKREEQRVTYALDRDTMYQRAMDTSATREAEHRSQIEERCKNPVFATHFSVALARKREVLAKTLGVDVASLTPEEPVSHVGTDTDADITA